MHGLPKATSILIKQNYKGVPVVYMMPNNFKRVLNSVNFKRSDWFITSLILVTHFLFEPIYYLWVLCEQRFHKVMLLFL